jgi:hypothetical protein
LGKSELVHVGEVEDVDWLASVLGSKVGTLPMQYLSSPLGASFKARVVWSTIIERTARNLAGWKILQVWKILYLSNVLLLALKFASNLGTDTGLLEVPYIDNFGGAGVFKPYMSCVFVNNISELGSSKGYFSRPVCMCV